MGTEATGMQQPYNIVGQQEGPWMRGMAPEPGPDPKAQLMPAGPEQGGLPGLTPQAGLPSQSPSTSERVKMLLAQLMQGKTR